MPLDQVDIDEIDQKEEKNMSFFDHIEELRWHVIRSLIAILVCGIAIFSMGSFFIDNVVLWPKNSDFITYRAVCWLSNELGLGDYGCFSPPDFKVKALRLEEMFVTHLKISVVAGFIIAFPYVFWQFWQFVSPALKPSERKYTKGIVFVCSLLFILGVSFGYFVISPFAISFLTSYELSKEVFAEIQVSSFVSSITLFSIPTGVVFQLPLVILFFAKIGIVTSNGLKKFRKHAFILILILAAIITPPDIITQFFIGIPLYILYEISILIAKRVEKKDQLREISKT